MNQVDLDDPLITPGSIYDGMYWTVVLVGVSALFGFVMGLLWGALK